MSDGRVGRIVVSGANGFVGRAVSRLLIERGVPVNGLVRAGAECEPGVTPLLIDSLDLVATAALQGASAVIHLAARVHVMRDDVADPLAAFRATNVAGTLALAEAAHRAGVPRFVFMSSIKALAETDSGRPLTERDERRPPDPYGVSKAEAEVKLLEFGARSGLEIVVIRTPLVYGPGVRANFLSLFDAIAKGWPLPIGAVTARRSLCYVGNLASATVECATNPRAAGEIFHVTDGDDPSVAGLARLAGRHLGRRARLVPVPVGWLKLAGRITGKSAQIDRLTGSLRVDSTHIRERLDWTPPATLNEGLAATAAWYRTPLPTHPPRAETLPD